MTKEEKVKYRMNRSDDDLTVAHTMLASKHYLYVGFMCHQVIEKTFKAYYKDETQPYTHELPYLAQEGCFYETLPEEQTNPTFAAMGNKGNIIEDVALGMIKQTYSSADSYCLYDSGMIVFETYFFFSIPHLPFMYYFV